MAESNLCAVLWQEGPASGEDVSCEASEGCGNVCEESRAVPQAGPGELQIRVQAVGICGSDVSLWKNAAIGQTALKDPLVLGHEPCGTVAGVGPGVTGFAVGDLVAMSPNISCYTCRPCREGRQNLCDNRTKMATPPTDGCIANFIVWPSRLCYKLPPGITPNEGAFIQPIALALHGCQMAGIRPGHRVLICGADINEERLKFLASVTKGSTVHVQGETPEDTAERVKKELGGFADVTLECSAAPTSIAVSFYATKLGGCVLLAGISPDAETKIPLRSITAKELNVKGMFRFANDYETAVELISSRAIDARPLVTHTFPLENVTEAFEAAARGERHLWIQKHRNKYKGGNIRASVISSRRVTATMAQVNLCAVLYGKRDLRMENQPIPQPGPNELQIRMLVVGICGSDVGMWEGAMSPGTTLPIMDPIVLGHEPCGVVCGLGFSVSGFAIGDKVTMDPNLSCRACRTCKSGRHNLCEKGIAMMTEHPTDGCLSNYIVWPADLCYR
ncbi:hypothetical protein C0Q70_20339 [Pomacea canaliculata]|uniref:Sorbitol dehydrogenase n=1 Tax=Pomacea canaliculata TaxID=400727 RepID=A0A2T7NFA6_POMCA|nr:hypothetical protein C0Q70_20339 [Pomacea canaliculata]